MNLLLKSLLTFSLAAASFISHGQNVSISTGDTVETEQGKVAKTDEIYFDALKAKLHNENRQAENLLKDFIAQRPSVAAAHYELAKIYVEEKRTELALNAIKKALALEPDNKWYKETQAAILAMMSKYAEAAEIYAALCKSEPKDPEYPILAAEYYERAGKQKEALEYIDIALKRNMDDEELLIQKMRIFLNLNQPNDAAAVVQQLITQEPKNGKYYKLLAELYDNNKMSDKATVLLKEAEVKLPRDPFVQLGIATHSLKTGDTAKYRQYVKKAIVNPDIETELQIELLKGYVQSLPSEKEAISEALPLIQLLAAQEPADATIFEYYGEILEISNKNDSAVIAYKKSLAIKPNNFNVWLRLMGNYLDKPYADSLIRISERAIKLFPNQAIAHFYNGVGYMNKGNNAQAVKAITRAIDLQPEGEKEELSQMYSTLADAYHANKQYSLSDAAFEKALNLAPNNATTLNNYAYYLSERGAKLDEAEKMSKKSMELRPDEATFLDTYGWILYKKADFSNAKTYIQRAIDLAKDQADGTLYNHLGNILFKLNDKTKAVEAWKKAKEKGSDDKNLDKKISEGNLYE